VVNIDATQEPLPLREYIDLNPTGKGHWTYREFIEGKKPTGEPVRGWEAGNQGGLWRYAVMNPRDNPMLSADYIDTLEGLSERQRRRFLEGQYLSDVPGALWTSNTLEACRACDYPTLSRIVVAVDPPISAEEGSDECGIVVAGIDREGVGYVLEDCSVGQASPREWATAAVSAYHRWKADRIVAESNQGGEMVRHTIHTVGRDLPIKLVHASRGKAARAEPVSALYEQSKVRHIGAFTRLEDQMTSWVPGSSPKSPDRMDALVWALTELMIVPSVATFGSFGRL
jgi:phage terminase large subunit-like protein